MFAVFPVRGKEKAEKNEEKSGISPWRPRTASKLVKLQRPNSGRRVQSLRGRTWPPTVYGWSIVLRSVEDQSVKPGRRGFSI